jgi:hypothetical protein
MTFDVTKPKFVLYLRVGFTTYDLFKEFITKAVSNGINVIILSFIFFKTPSSGNGYVMDTSESAVTNWIGYSTIQQQEIKTIFKDGVILISQGGSSGGGQFTNYKGFGYQNIANDTLKFIKKNNLDGTDLDYESILTPEYTNYTNIVATTVKNNELIFTMSPQSPNMPYFFNIYIKIPTLIDWFNIQFYHQDSSWDDYTTSMICNGNMSCATSINGLITGKKTKIGSNPQSRCYGKTGICSGTTQTPIPVHKLVLGTCVISECPTGNIPITTAHLLKASQDTNGYFTDFFKQGGVAVWNYWGNSVSIVNNFKGTPPQDTRSKEDNDIWTFIQTVKPYFKFGPPPTTHCTGVNCGQYGVCEPTTGICTCYYGYISSDSSKKDCKIPPVCSTPSLNLSNLQVSNSLNDSGIKQNNGLKIAGIILSILGLISIIGLNFNKKYKKYNTLLFSICLISFISGVVLLIVWKNDTGTPPSKSCTWQSGEWSDCDTVSHKKSKSTVCKDNEGNDCNKCTGSSTTTSQDCKYSCTPTLTDTNKNSCTVDPNGTTTFEACSKSTNCVDNCTWSVSEWGDCDSGSSKQSPHKSTCKNGNGETCDSTKCGTVPSRDCLYSCQQKTCVLSKNEQGSIKSICDNKCNTNPLCGYPCTEGQTCKSSGTTTCTCRVKSSIDNTYKCAPCTPPISYYKCPIGGSTNTVTCQTNKTGGTGWTKGQCSSTILDTCCNPSSNCCSTDYTYSNGKCTNSKPGSDFDFSKFYSGVNLSGFDSTNNTTYQESNISCISEDLIDWSDTAEIYRFPILPVNIFTKPVTNTQQYDKNMFSQLWNNPNGKLSNCKSTDSIPVSSVWFGPKQPDYTTCPSYIPAVEYATSKKKYVIIDAHSNTHHLCSFGGTLMTPEMFVNMWGYIAQYVIENVTNHEYVMFELFNEPVIDNCVALVTTGTYKTQSAVWNNLYVIPAIKKIREIETSKSTKQHIVLVTTWGNWSGIHSWNTVGTSEQGDTSGTLQELVYDLGNSGYTSSSKDFIIFAGHQYCDGQYSGTTNDCDLSKFNPSIYNKWLSDTDTNIGNFKWILTEGNIVCKNPCTNGNVYIDFLNALKSTKSCIGFTVWGITFTGMSNNMAKGTSGNYDNYNKFYPLKNSQYDFPGIVN